MARRRAAQPRWFQSSSGLSTGCYGSLNEQDLRCPRCKEFQSSSGLSTGCYPSVIEGVAQNRCSSFNPHPAFRPDATSARGGGIMPSRWFQSSSGLSTGCYKSRRFHPSAFPIVSILIRPFDRMLLGAMLAAYCNASWSRFNPHPAFRPDATARRLHSARLLRVSILIRPFDRMLLSSSGMKKTCSRFQSSSGLSTGCYCRALVFLPDLREPPAAVLEISVFQAFSPCSSPCVQLRARTSGLTVPSHRVRVRLPDGAVMAVALRVQLGLSWSASGTGREQYFARLVLRRQPAVLWTEIAYLAGQCFGGSRRRPGPRQPDVHVPDLPVVVGLQARERCQQPTEYFARLDQL